MNLTVIIKRIKAKLPWNKIPTTPRIVKTNAPEENKKKANKFSGNSVSTAKYNVITFLPQNLLEQFLRVANIYFLIVSLLQLFSGLSPTGRVGTIVPLIFVIIFQMIKDGFEDLKRHIADRQVNKSKTHVLREGDRIEQILWDQVVVGDIVQVEQDEALPADLVCLTSSEPGGLCYIETSQLDGETNLKIRRSLHATSHYLPQDLFTLKSTITCEQPNNQLYKFIGKIQIDESEKVIPIEVEQILLRGAVLKNTRRIYGVAVYTGRHSKLMMNSEDPPHKRSKVEKATNLAIIGLFCFEIFITILCSFGIGIWQTVHSNMWYLYKPPITPSAVLSLEGLVTFFILFNNFIPISLYVSMEFVKMLQARWLIDQDIEMYYEPADMPAVAKTSSLNEELGQVEHIFSDKTGTLTQNVMEFLKFSIDGVEYGRGTTEIGRAAALRNNIELIDDRPSDWKSSIEGFNFYDERILDGEWRKQPTARNMRLFFTLLAVCHTVVPELDKTDPSKLVYQAASPDEGALVKAAASLGFKFLSRTPTSCTIDADGQEETYEVLNVLEFNSTRKRMSVIVRTPDNRIVLMTKGADNVIYKLMKPNEHAETTHQNLKKFAEEGLRTLVCAQVELEKEFYYDWNQNVFEKANTSLVNKEDAVAAAAEIVEQNLELVGATAIEDKLQDGVPDTISELAKAGIKIWVLTGDKQETAINIGYACALLDNTMTKMVFNITNRQVLKSEIRRHLELVKAGQMQGDLAVVIDGASLELVLQKKKKSKKHAERQSSHEPTMEEKHKIQQETSEPSVLQDEDQPGEEPLSVTFLKLCLFCKSVICCRVSPLQKALVVKMTKENLPGSITLAIGDGANDVSMIQAAHIGVGISGQEGLQAARASDYAIGQFRFLKRLLLVHGRYNYRRIAKLICYSFYKNLTLQLCQFWFVFFNAFTGTSVYDSLLLALFNIIFTSLPIIVFALFDRDISVESSMKVPQLYTLGQNSYYFNMRVFFGWVLNSIWHSLVCFFISYLSIMTATLFYGIPAEYNNLTYMVYTCVIVITTLKVLLESASVTIIHHLSFYGSILSWFFIVVVYAAVWPAVDVIIPARAPRGIVDIRYTMRGAYFDFYNSAGNGVYWFSLVLAVVIALSKDIIWKAIVHNVTLGKWLRQVYHVVQDMEFWRLEVNEETVKSECPELFMRLKPPMRTLKSKSKLQPTVETSTIISPEQQPESIVDLGVRNADSVIEEEHTGFGFAQTEGGLVQEMLKSASFRGSFRRKNTANINDNLSDGTTSTPGTIISVLDEPILDTTSNKLI